MSSLVGSPPEVKEEIKEVMDTIEGHGGQEEVWVERAMEVG